jgi:hypothetical protein
MIYLTGYRPVGKSEYLRVVGPPTCIIRTIPYLDIAHPMCLLQAGRS